MKDQSNETVSRVAYIGEMAAELAIIARRENRPLLVRLLEMVVLEVQSPDRTTNHDRAN